MAHDEVSDPARQTAEIWEQLGAWWDDYIGPQGNDFHREVVGPTTEKLLDVRPGERVLDVACGNGQFSRRLAELGADVVAVDISETFIERAKAHEHDDRISYHVADATDEARLTSLGSFDAAVANMALMDMHSVEPLFRALSKILRPGGRFVFTILHPCFGYPVAGGRWKVSALNRGLAILQQLVPDRLRLVFVRRIEPLLNARHSLRYREPAARQGIGIIGQPVPHWYFHRPLESLLAGAFSAGLHVDGLAEPPMPGEPGRAALLAVRLRKPRDSGQ